MKHNRSISGIVCARIAIVTLIISLSLAAAKAQQSQNILEGNAEINFTQVKVGATQCLPLLARNTNDSSISITDLHFIAGSEYFTLSDSIKLPKSISPGESLVLGNLCFVSKAPNKEYIGYMKLTYSSQASIRNSEIRVDALTQIDSSLLLPCYSVTFDSAMFGPVFYGGQSIRTMSVTNNLDSTRTIRCIDFTLGDNKAFSGRDNHFPLSIPPHGTRQIHIMFMPLAPKSDGSDNFRSKVKIESMDSGDLCAPDYDIYGTALRPTDMNTMNPFDRSSILPTLRMSSTDSIFGQTFLFANTDKDSLLIKSIILDSQYVNFTLEPLNACSHLPMVAAPGDYMAVRISLAASPSIIYYNKLRFVLGNGMAPIVYNVEAMRVLPQDIVRPVISENSPFTFSTIPNPSSGSITIELSGAGESDIEIFDASGKLVTAEKNISASWVWNGHYSNGTRVSAGSYFIRAATRDKTGKMQIATKQVSILH